MFKKFLTGFVLVGAVCFTSSVLACTIFAAQGDAVNDGGLIIVKNRDAAPEVQSVKKYSSSKYSYYGLYGTTRKGAPLLLGGVNETGLVVIHSKASLLKDEHQDVIGKSVVNENLLKYCSSVEECLQNTQYLTSPFFLLIGDTKEIATIEVGPKKELHIERISNGTLSHTNHYTDPSLKKYDAKTGMSTYKRLKKIKELLQKAPKPMSLDDAITISEDRSSGVDNSIWREGVSANATQTISRFVVHLHQDKSFDVRVDYRPSERKVFKTIVTNSAELFGK